MIVWSQETNQWAMGIYLFIYYRISTTIEVCLRTAQNRFTDYVIPVRLTRSREAFPPYGSHVMGHVTWVTCHNTKLWRNWRKKSCWYHISARTVNALLHGHNIAIKHPRVTFIPRGAAENGHFLRGWSYHQIVIQSVLETKTCNNINVFIFNCTAMYITGGLMYRMKCSFSSINCKENVFFLV